VLQCLKTLRLPQVRAKDETIKILTDKPWKNINVHHMPIPITFYFIGSEEHVLLDPNAKEEKVCTSRNTVFMNVFGDICGIHTLGVLDLSFETYNRCLAVAETKAKEVTKVIRDQLSNIEEFKMKNIISDLDQMKIDDDADADTHAQGKASKDQFIKTIKETIDKDFDNEQLDDNLIVSTMKRQKIPKLGEDSAKRGAVKTRGKRNFKASYKSNQDKKNDDDDEEEEVVHKLENPYAK